VEGPEVALEVGLRQGCVLSPMLYCVFMDALVQTGPAAPVPLRHRGTAELFFAQGLQQALVHGVEEVGLESEFLDAPLHSTIYMDDTSIFATSIEGLKAVIRAYQNFCKKFQMRINAGKSSVLKMGEGVPPDQGGFEVVVDGQVYSAPKCGSQKLLGFLCDGAMDGERLLQAAMGKAGAKAQQSKIVASRLGEAEGLKHMEMCTTPAVLYNTEMVVGCDVKIGKRLDKAWVQTIGDATQVGEANKWWGGEPMVSQQALQWHGFEVPWGVQRKVRRARLASKVASAKAGLAAELFRGQMRAGKLDPVVKGGVDFLAETGQSLCRPPQGQGLKKWKAGLRDAVVKQHLRALEVGSQVDRINDGKSDMLMWHTLGVRTGQAGMWEDLLPATAERTRLHKLKLGSVPFLRTARAKVFRRRREWGKLSKPARDGLQRCVCGAEAQTAGHVWKECPVARPILDQALRLAPEAVDWNILPVWERLKMALSPELLNNPDKVRPVKRQLIRQFLAAVPQVEVAVGWSEARFVREFRYALQREAVPEGCAHCWVEVEGDFDVIVRGSPPEGCVDCWVEIETL